MIAPWVTQTLVLLMVALYTGLTILEALGHAERPADLILFTKWCVAAALGIDAMGRIRLALLARKQKLEQKDEEKK